MEKKKRQRVTLAEDFFPEVKCSKTGRLCGLKYHYRLGSVLRQVAGAIDLLADNNDQRVVYAGNKAIRKMCHHFEKGERAANVSLRSVVYALAVFRKQGVISGRVKVPLTWTGLNGPQTLNGGRAMSGFAVIDHKIISTLDQRAETCSIVMKKKRWAWVYRGQWTDYKPLSIFNDEK